MIAEYGWALAIFPGIALVGFLVLVVVILKHSSKMKEIWEQLELFDELALKTFTVSECFDLLHTLDDYKDRKAKELMPNQMIMVNRTVTYLNGLKKGLENNENS